jgi:hypothetical protein
VYLEIGDQTLREIYHRAQSSISIAELESENSETTEEITESAPTVK